MVSTRCRPNGVIKMKHLSYATLYNLEDELKKQINMEKQAITFLDDYSEIKLQLLQNDLKLVKQAIAEKNKFIRTLFEEI